ncbi:MAG: type II secretion system protein [Bacteriovoracaceae bacterium]|nr:type II secretion system protein [Bacteriovoracaceae bacterium]
MKKLLGQNGFTLMEILISITILAFISIGVVTIVNNSVDTSIKVTAEDNEKLAVYTGLSRIAWDIGQIYSPLYFSEEKKKATSNGNNYNGNSNSDLEKFRNNDNFYGYSADGLQIPKIKQESKEELEFLTSANRRRVENVKQSDYSWVKYKYERMDSKDEKDQGLNQLVRYFVSENPFGEEKRDYSRIRSYIILRRLKEFKFEFWDKKKEKFVDRLRDIQDKNERNIIRSLKVSFKWITAEGHEEEVEKTYRPLWPYFEEEKEDPKSKKK